MGRTASLRTIAQLNTVRGDFDFDRRYDLLPLSFHRTHARASTQGLRVQPIIYSNCRYRLIRKYTQYTCPFM